MTVLVWYHVAVRIMKRVVDLMRQQADPGAQAVDAAGVSQSKRVGTHYATALTSIPLRPEHWARAVRAAVDYNVAIRNYGVGARGIEMIRRKAQEDPSAVRAVDITALERTYAQCSSNRFANAYPQPSMSVCFHTLNFIGPASVTLKCSVCPAIFLAAAGYNRTQRCPCCHLGVLM
uniref:Uncharacterized protein n=1 Tax=Erythrolobus madagascarensis TaxID=708628 RepID=A0A7S0XJ46_9RHOD